MSWLQSQVQPVQGGIQYAENGERKTKPKLVIENPFLSLNTLSNVSSWSFPTVSAGVKISAQVFVPLKAAEEALQPPTEVKCPTAQQALPEQGWTESPPP